MQTYSRVYLGPDYTHWDRTRLTESGISGSLVSGSHARFAVDGFKMRLSMRLLALLAAARDLGRGAVNRLWPRRRRTRRKGGVGSDASGLCGYGEGEVPVTTEKGNVSIAVR